MATRERRQSYFLDLIQWNDRAMCLQVCVSLEEEEKMILKVTKISSSHCIQFPQTAWSPPAGMQPLEWAREAAIRQRGLSLSYKA